MDTIHLIFGVPMEIGVTAVLTKHFLGNWFNPWALSIIPALILLNTIWAVIIVHETRRPPQEDLQARLSFNPSPTALSQTSSTRETNHDPAG